MSSKRGLFSQGDLVLMEDATVELQSQGFLKIRYWGTSRFIPLTPTEFDIWKALIADFQAEKEEREAKSQGAVNGWQTKAKAKAAAK